MNLSSMKARLRARLNERIPDAFQDDEDLVPLLNEGARYVGKKLHAINRRVNTIIDCTDVIATPDPVRRYPMPTDFLFEIEVHYGAEPQTSQDPDREKLTHVEPNRGKRGYYMDGMWLNLTFDPTEDISCGLQVKHCAAISMIDDEDIPPIPNDLHMAIVVAAERFAVPQTGERAREQLEELNELLGDLETYYKAENAEQPQVRPTNLGRRY